jgi:hypothetical protein
MHMRRGTRWIGLSSVIALATACASDSSPTGDDTSVDHRTVDKGAPVVVALSEADQQRAAALREMAGASRALTADQLRAKRARKHVETLGYDPTTAQGMPALQQSTYALNRAEMDALKERGFVVIPRHMFPTMIGGYAALYVLDLPLYVSADSILDSVYRSYDAILRESEETALLPALGSLLDGMRKSLAARKPRLTTKDALIQSRMASDGVTDADFYLAVAKSLLEGKTAQPVAGASAAAIDSFAKRATAASGHEKRVIFGVERDIDFSQFKPRGHYEANPALERYFRAMMWLGRLDLRLIETASDGEQVFHRRALDTVVLLRELVRANEANWNRIDATLRAFVGESDYMRVSEVDQLLSDLGATPATLASLSDQRIAQTILENGYGVQQIASQLIVNETEDLHTLPLDRSFALFGQRYTVDSHVFSNVVFDRVKGRLMPNPLDVAYAAFGNDTAVSAMAPDLDVYAGALEATRALVDAHEPQFWDKNLYNLWSKALRALSPVESADSREKPSVTGTEAWDRRILNTQLASWSQLRHNTVLYAKQSTTSGLSCAYPDAYVEPYPEFFAALEQFAKYGSDLSDVLSGGRSTEGSVKIREYFGNLRKAVKILGAMAVAQRAGEPHTDEQLAFINQAVHAKFVGCVGPATYDGWFAKLDYEVDSSGLLEAEAKPVISDVHTQPTDEAGNDIGRILHVATGLPRLMVVTANTCQGARVYAGLASSYHEVTTDGWNRIPDSDWRRQIISGSKPEEVEWTTAFTPAVN